VVCLFFYRIDKKLEIQIADELTERRRLYVPVAAESPMQAAGHTVGTH
jgi:hypothetical protein